MRSLFYVPALTKEKKKEMCDRIKIGTVEWVRKGGEINICKGCLNNCAYCYARSILHRNNTINFAEWGNKLLLNLNKKIPAKIRVKRKKDEKGNEEILDEKIKKHDFMLPTASDIFPNSEEHGKIYDLYCAKFDEILTKGYTLLITSKPREEIIGALIDKYAEYKNQITFRFTITSTDQNMRKFMEPNASEFDERLECLKMTYNRNFNNSISIEPLLDPNPIQIISKIKPYLSKLQEGRDLGVIWVGLLRSKYTPVWYREEHGLTQIFKKIARYQKFKPVFEWYAKYYDDPQIQFKDTVKKLMIKNNVKVK